MATHILEMNDDEHFEFELFGISSREKDFRVAWALNVALDWQLERVSDVEVNQREGVSHHSRFMYTDPEDQTVFVFLSNASEGGWLLSQWSSFDYLLKVQATADYSPELLSKILRKVPFVLAVFPLELEKIKSKYNLINA
jgi:hypothetical protein